MNLVFAPSMCLATMLLGLCNDSGTFCEFNLPKMIDTVVATNSPDKDTQAIKPDAEALQRNLRDHSAGGGPSSGPNSVSFQRFREFVKKKCHGKDIGPSLTGLTP